MPFNMPVQNYRYDQQRGFGFATPTIDQTGQTFRVLPRGVVPVIFLPGIMGSNLKITDAERQRRLRQKDNIAWRPDNLSGSHLGMVTSSANALPRDRQLRLDPTTTAVDIYDPSGPPDVSGDERFANVVLADGFETFLLCDDPPMAKPRRTAVQKARERGWGEVYFGSYGAILQRMEQMLSGVFERGRLRDEWKSVVGVDPKIWQPHPSLPQQSLTEEELKAAITGRFFPVHAIGYNWLCSNDDSAKVVAKRIEAIIDDYNERKFQCEKVIVVTHSMGGLLGRALIHPDYGNLKDKVLGIVHGVQPATGAAAAYKRIRAGFDDPGLLGTGIAESLVAKIGGNCGMDVTPVLANSPGGLQLLPSKAYGMGWLKVVHDGNLLAALPKSDPFSEIYKSRGKWYSMIREDWINPAGIDGVDWKSVIKNIERAEEFHRKIAGTYHDVSYAHYGADKLNKSFGDVTWEIKAPTGLHSIGWDRWKIVSDDGQGRLALASPSEFGRLQAQAAEQLQGLFGGAYEPNAFAPMHASIVPGDEPGDTTVPMRSADDQLRSGKFKGVFRQTGYDHQNSYKNEHAIACTLYSIIRIAQQDREKRS